jgi:hypothetical protein
MAGGPGVKGSHLRAVLSFEVGNIVPGVHDLYFEPKYEEFRLRTA